MPAYSLSNFHEGMRTMLGDGGDPVGGWDYLDLQLNQALRTAVRMGKVPCLLIDPANEDQLLSAPANPDTWAYLLASAVHLMIATPLEESFRTRALSVTIDSRSRANAVNNLEITLADLDARGNVCGTAGDITHKGLFATEGDAITHLRICDPPIDVESRCCPPVL